MSTAQKLIRQVCSAPNGRAGAFRDSCCREQAEALSRRAESQTAASGWLVAYSSLTPKSGFVRVGGDPPATRENSLQRLRKTLDEEVALSH
jgi:hypothetical protein